MIQFTFRVEGTGYPSMQMMKTEETMSTDTSDIVTSIVLWLAIVTVFAIL